MFDHKCPNNQLCESFWWAATKAHKTDRHVLVVCSLLNTFVPPPPLPSNCRCRQQKPWLKCRREEVLISKVGKTCPCLLPGSTGGNLWPQVCETCPSKNRNLTSRILPGTTASQQGHMGLTYFFPPKHVRGPLWRILIPQFGFRQRNWYVSSRWWKLCTACRLWSRQSKLSES